MVSGSRRAGGELSVAPCPVSLLPSSPGISSQGAWQRPLYQIAAGEAWAAASLLTCLCVSGCRIGPHKPVDGVIVCLGAVQTSAAGGPLTRRGGGASGGPALSALAGGGAC